MTFDGKVVLVTGASRGIGAETARAFAGAGAKVVLAARSEADLAALADEIGPDATAVAMDAAVQADVERAVATAVDTYGGLDIVIANAAVIEPIAHLAKADADAWGRLIDINVKGVFYAMRAAVPAMEARGGGTFITISSGAASNALEGWSAYCTSKAGAAMLTRCLDKEYRARGIRAMGLSPGTVATEMQRVIKNSGVNPVSQLDWSDHIPPDWPAKCLLWMAGPAGNDLLGQEVSLREEAVRRAVGLID